MNLPPKPRRPQPSGRAPVGRFFFYRAALDAAARRRGYDKIAALGTALGMRSQNWYAFHAGKKPVGRTVADRVAALLQVPTASILVVEIGEARYRLAPP